MIIQKTKPLVKIYTIHYNRPEFIKWQWDSFYKFMTNPFQMVVVNNARTDETREELLKTTNELGLDTIHTFSDIPFAYAGAHHASAINTVWQKYICYKEKGLVCITDGDIFPLNYIRIAKANWTVYGAPQHRKGYEYITPTIVFLNMRNLYRPEDLDWEGIKVYTVDTYLDTGGGFYNYFRNYPKIKRLCYLMNQSWHIKENNKNLHLIPKEVQTGYKEGFDVELFDNKFLHYCRSSGWNPHESETFHREKQEWVKDLIYKCIHREILFSPRNFDMKNEYLGWRNNV